MSEQFIEGYAIDAAKLAALPGSKTSTLLARTKKQKQLFEEMGELVGEAEVIEQLLVQITSGKLMTKHAYRYRRLLQLVAASIGTQQKPSSVTLPGRGWHELGPAWSHWGLKTLGAKWSALDPWPWAKLPKGVDVAWPVGIIVAKRELPAIREELESFDPAVIAERGVPKTVARFGTGEWDAESLGNELENFTESAAKWAEGAMKKKLDLLIWIDGQQ